MSILSVKLEIEMCTLRKLQMLFFSERENTEACRSAVNVCVCVIGWEYIVARS